MQQYLTNNYSPLDVNFVRGKGVFVYDNNGTEYLDALSGVAVSSLGHSHPQIVNAICTQAKKILHSSNWYEIKPQQQLAKKLVELSGLAQVFFANSGAEANEAAIKLTRLFAQQNNINKPTIITANNSFHGRTMATLSATGNKTINENFKPLLPDFINVEYNNIAAIKKLSANKNIVAVMLEPILGESGVIIPDDDYLNKVRIICDHNKWLMILDEVQTGMGRTGKMFAYEYNNIKPDVLTLAKGLGGGVPIGACVINKKYSKLLTPGSHGSTFGGNHLSTTAALAVIKTIETESLLANVNAVSDYLATKLRNLTHNTIKELRIKGFMIGIELTKKPKNLMQQALQQRLLINVTGNTIRILPPLILTHKEAAKLVDKIANIISKL